MEFVRCPVELLELQHSVLHVTLRKRGGRREREARVEREDSEGVEKQERGGWGRGSTVPEEGQGAGGSCQRLQQT